MPKMSESTHRYVEDKLAGSDSANFDGALGILAECRSADQRVLLSINLIDQALGATM